MTARRGSFANAREVIEVHIEELEQFGDGVNIGGRQALFP